jgi:phage shock protein A
MPFSWGKPPRPEELDAAAAVEQVLRRMRNDRTEARFQVRAAMAAAERLEAQAEGAAPDTHWSQVVGEHRRRVELLHQDLIRLEEKVREAETWAKALAARASSARARLSLGGFLEELETGDAVEAFHRLQSAVQELEGDVAGLKEVEKLLGDGLA